MTNRLGVIYQLGVTPLETCMETSDRQPWTQSLFKVIYDSLLMCVKHHAVTKSQDANGDTAVGAT